MKPGRKGDLVMTTGFIWVVEEAEENSLKIRPVFSSREGVPLNSSPVCYKNPLTISNIWREYLKPAPARFWELYYGNGWRLLRLIEQGRVSDLGVEELT